MVASLLCQRCGSGFEAKRSDALWCSACRLVRVNEKSQKYDRHHREPCPDCGRPMVRRADYCLRCSNRRRGEKRRAENNGNWRNGRTHAQGYTFVRTKTGNGGGAAYTAEHRLVWEAAHGLLPEGYVVHHLNGLKDDNRLENLAAMPRNGHNPRLVVAPYEARIRQLEEQQLTPIRG